MGFFDGAAQALELARLAEQATPVALLLVLFAPMLVSSDSRAEEVAQLAGRKSLKTVIAKKVASNGPPLL